MLPKRVFTSRTEPDSAKNLARRVFGSDGMTIAEKLLAHSSGREKVVPGEIIESDLDLILMNDVTGPLAIDQFHRIGVDRVFDSGKIALVTDHYAPNKDIMSAEQCKVLREFSREMGVENYWEIGSCGIEHVLLPESGLVQPGMTIIGADSHTCTYGAFGAFATGVGSTEAAVAMATGRCWFRIPQTQLHLVDGRLMDLVTSKDVILSIIGRIGVDGASYISMEFGGRAVRQMTMDSRATMCNMAIEAGAKCGIVEPDEVTLSYVSSRVVDPIETENLRSDEDCAYASTFVYDADSIEPVVAVPSLPSNVVNAADIGEVEIDQAFLGSCTNGKLEDLALAARVMGSDSVHPHTRMIVIPATWSVYRQAMEKGYIDTFLEAGACVSCPTCGPCLGGHMGVLAAGERCISSTNRNFVGRMGSTKSEVYLASPATVAASAITGRITDPRLIQ
jgi:3-isopropylmalate/(R)-2-methylmalate dehydratase large subunit